jgi:ABC-type phosphate/phosphonate transport system permease subunit
LSLAALVNRTVTQQLMRCAIDFTRAKPLLLLLLLLLPPVPILL